jgi:hypothetical protein
LAVDICVEGHRKTGMADQFVLLASSLATATLKEKVACQSSSTTNQWISDCRTTCAFIAGGSVSIRRSWALYWATRMMDRFPDMSGSNRHRHSSWLSATRLSIEFRYRRSSPASRIRSKKTLRNASASWKHDCNRDTRKSAARHPPLASSSGSAKGEDRALRSLNAMLGVATGRILAVDLRPRRLGYATVEAPMYLLDSGVIRYTSAKEATARIESLIGRFHPRVLVLRRISKKSRRNRARTRIIIRRLCRCLRGSPVRIVFVSEPRLKKHFQRKGEITKQDIASSLASTFPELQWKLPPRRKSWEIENWRMSAFDAIALAVAFVGTNTPAASIRDSMAE